MIPLISRALLSWRQLCAMYLAHVRSFKAELTLFVPFLQILARSVCFCEKGGLYAARIPRRGKSMGVGF